MLCPTCNEDKPQDPTKPARTKANGFYGKYCWDCHKKDALDRLHGRNAIQSPVLEALDAEYASLQAQLRTLQAKIQETRRAENQVLRAAGQKPIVRRATSKPVSKLYGDIVREAQNALDQFDVTCPNELGSPQRKAMHYTLKRAEYKVQLFGPNAFDVKSTRTAKSDDD